MNAPISKMFKENQDDACQSLCEAVKHEQEKYVEVAQAFFDDGRHTEAQCLKLTNAIITAVDNVLSAGDWEKTLFLKNTIKPLLKLRDEALGVKDSLLKEQGIIEINDYQLNEEEVKIYISLYQSEGHNMQLWEAQLASIDSYMAGRAIYSDEAHVQKAIRQKVMKTSEAYAILVVKKNKMLKQEFAPAKTDRSGHALVTLEVGAVKPDDIIEFVHLGKRYHFYKQRLIQKKRDK